MAEEKGGSRGIFERALDVHQLKREHILAQKIRGDTITLVTTGGQKIVWKDGAPPVAIPAHQHPEAKPIERKRPEKKK